MLPHGLQIRASGGRVNWKVGKTFKINIKEYIDKNGKIDFPTIRNAIPNFTEKEYYMIVLKPEDISVY